MFSFKPKQPVKFTCPRRHDTFVPQSKHDNLDRWRSDGTCSFCGSLAPEEFFLRIAKEEPITPTDKSYKCYIGDYKKFYFQHLTIEQQKHFIALYNDGKLKLEYPHYFYVTPYFCVKKSQVKNATP